MHNDLSNNIMNFLILRVNFYIVSINLVETFMILSLKLHLVIL